ncbi:MAG: helix-hairpin-helix domain-containing protein [Rikenellaceae bacterium]
MFSYQEKRGILYLLLLIFVVALCVDMVRKRRLERIAEPASEVVVDTIRTDSTFLFEFDPNTATQRDLRKLGLDKNIANSIIRWREAGKIFRIKEDLSESYNMPDSVYYAIEPYIKIGAEFRYEKKERTITTTSKPKVKRTLTPLSPFTIDTVGIKYLYSTGLFSPRQAEVFIKYYRSGGLNNMYEVRECIVVSDSIANVLEQYIVFPPEKDKLALIDINKADSAELRSVKGIGEKSVVAIMNYRQKLGGFYSVEQLSELKEVTESNFERIIRQISCDSCDISKIDINFAVAKKLIEHPYITPMVVRRLLKTRQIKGGWSSIAEMTEDNIFTQEEAQRLRPYVRFEEYTKLR